MSGAVKAVTRGRVWSIYFPGRPRRVDDRDVDGIEQGDQAIPLVDDRQEHSVEVRINLHSSEDSTAPNAYLWLPPIGRSVRWRSWTGDVVIGPCLKYLVFAG